MINRLPHTQDFSAQPWKKKCGKEKVEREKEGCGAFLPGSLAKRPFVVYHPVEPTSPPHFLRSLPSLDNAQPWMDQHIRIGMSGQGAVSQGNEEIRRHLFFFLLPCLAPMTCGALSTAPPDRLRTV